MTSCLYECLCEAELEQYYPHFAAVGLQKIDELAKITMKDYSKLGVRSMSDRRRLFQLIKIIQIAQEEDQAASRSKHRLQARSRHPLQPQDPQPGPRRQLHFDSPADGRDGTVGNRGSEPCCSAGIPADEPKPGLVEMLEDVLPGDGRCQPKSKIPTAAPDDPYLPPEIDTSADDLSPYWGDGRLPIVQRVTHGSGYNYGVPHSSFRQSTSEQGSPWTETERIHVCVRKRPLGLREERRGEVNIIRVEDQETLLVHEKKEAVDLTQYILQHVFYFDEVFGEACTNQDVYMKTTHPLIQHIFNGGNATCFAYGQTGAGKTYTMIGTHQNPGLYALAAKDIFDHLEASQPRRDLHVWVSFYEIYCGQLYDLLNGRKRLFAREDSKHIVQIVELRELRVDNVDLLLEVILKGGKERSIGATGVNSDSSRSHAVIQIQIKDSAKRTLGRISFIDLAGSERASDAKDSDKQTKIEGAEINQSLLALKECIRALDQEHAHTPFRQSKLTQVLKDSFVGNSKTCMIANISPSHIATEHTLNTLRYADRVKELKRGMKCCPPMTGQSQRAGHLSPKRNQCSSSGLPGEKSSPKKVKLGMQSPLPQGFGPAGPKAYPLAFHPANVPLSSTPKVAGKGKSSRANPSYVWLAHTSPVRGTLRAGSSGKKKVAEGAPGSEKAPRRPAEAPRNREVGRSEDGRRGRKVQTVRPVQKQLVPREELSFGEVLPAEKGGHDGGSRAARPGPAGRAGVPLRQKEREDHLRSYHRQFQQPPLFRQQLKPQPQERFLCRHGPRETGVRQDGAPVPSPPGPRPQDGTHPEDLDDSDFSEDSFTHVSGQRSAPPGSPGTCGQPSFFLHQSGDRGAAGRPAGDGDALLFRLATGPRGGGPDVGRGRPGGSSRARAEEPDRDHGGRSPADWSPGGGPASPAASPDSRCAERPRCSRGGLGCGRKNGCGASVHPGRFAGPSPAPPDARSPSPGREVSGLSLSRLADPPSPDPAGEREGDGEDPRAPLAGTGPRGGQSEGGESYGGSGSSAEFTSGPAAPLTVSLLESTDGEVSGETSPEPGQDAPVTGRRASGGRVRRCGGEARPLLGKEGPAAEAMAEATRPWGREAGPRMEEWWLSLSCRAPPPGCGWGGWPPVPVGRGPAGDVPGGDEQEDLVFGTVTGRGSASGRWYDADSEETPGSWGPSSPEKPHPVEEGPAGGRGPAVQMAPAGTHAPLPYPGPVPFPARLPTRESPPGADPPRRDPGWAAGPSSLSLSGEGVGQLKQKRIGSVLPQAGFKPATQAGCRSTSQAPSAEHVGLLARRATSGQPSGASSPAGTSPAGDWPGDDLERARWSSGPTESSWMRWPCWVPRRRVCLIE
ncbi:kinesin-like protein KIF24 isoform X2 [Ornithorhynchus anatinus]|uniref:kinesin-like protein KIF24 isoform X2 n=1 Tax=Ornithorhynchus anatinus TaxID=9258 RepID=UPI0010A9245E|nr:kinesin-like protein KIF24 isoform X2 [Ornithorhynchus anatinus]